MTVGSPVESFDFWTFPEFWELSVVHWQALTLAVGLGHRFDVLDESTTWKRGQKDESKTAFCLLQDS